jgi:hypothetical protein
MRIAIYVTTGLQKGMFEFQKRPKREILTPAHRRSQMRNADTMKEDMQNMEKEHALVLKKLGDEATSKDRNTDATASAEETIRNQQLKIDSLQQQLHYLALVIFQQGKSQKIVSEVKTS